MMHSLYRWIGLRPRTQAARRPGRAALALEPLEDRAVPALVGDLVVFGDSLSDAGNAAIATGGVLPNPLYFQGRFSNGPLGVDHLAEALGEPAPQPSLAGGLDYAVAGARIDGASPFPYNAVPDVGAQVDAYVAAHAADVDAADVYVFWAGPNDLFFGDYAPRVLADPTNPAVLNEVLNDVGGLAGKLAGQMGELYAHGARRFVVADMPLLGQTPYFLDQGDPKATALFNGFSLAFNTGLGLSLDSLRASLPGIEIQKVDAAGLLTEASLDPTAFGFHNVTDAVGPYNALGHVTSVGAGVDPDGYLFWDSVHPSARTHELLGTRAAAQVLTALGVGELVVDSDRDGIDPVDGRRTLREQLALADAMAGPQQISFTGRGYLPITITGGPLRLTGEVTLNRPAAPPVTLSGGHASRVLEVEGGATAVLNNVTVRDGRADQGGGIYNAGDLTLNHALLLGNRATGSATAPALGGAVYNAAGAKLTVAHSTLLGNTAGGAAVNGGGAVANDGPGAVAVLFDCTILGNQAVGGTLSFGGGVANLGGGSLQLVNTSVLANAAAAGPGGDARGGGVLNGSGSALDLRRSLVAGNLAVGARPRGEGAGGGVYLESGGTASRWQTLILGNFASTRGRDVAGGFV